MSQNNLRIILVIYYFQITMNNDDYKQLAENEQGNDAHAIELQDPKTQLKRNLFLKQVPKDNDSISNLKRESKKRSLNAAPAPIVIKNWLSSYLKTIHS